MVLCTALFEEGYSKNPGAFVVVVPICAATYVRSSTTSLTVNLDLAVTFLQFAFRENSGHT